MAENKDEVYLRPSEVRYSQFSILNTFKDGTTIGELLDDLYFGRCFVSAIKPIEVTQVKGRWYSADNRRLWVFKTLESVGKLDRVLVKVKQRIFHGKMTTKDDGQTVRIRGGDPGGKLWEAIEQIDKENAPKKRKRKRNRKKKKNKQADVASKVSVTYDSVDKPDISEAKPSESIDERDRSNGRSTNNSTSAILLATVQELNGMLQAMKSFGQPNAEASSEENTHDSYDDSDEDLDIDYGDRENAQDTQDVDFGEEEDFSYESMYESSEDEKPYESSLQTTQAQTHIYKHNVEPIWSNGVLDVQPESRLSNVPKTYRNVTNNMYCQSSEVQNVSFIKPQYSRNESLIQRQHIENVPITQRARVNTFSNWEEVMPSMKPADSCRQKTRVPGTSTAFETTPDSYSRALERLEELAMGTYDSNMYWPNYSNHGTRTSKIPDEDWNTLPRRTTYRDFSNSQDAPRQKSSDLPVDRKKPGDDNGFWKTQHSDVFKTRYPSPYGNSRRSHERQSSVSSIDSDTCIIYTTKADSDRREAKVHIPYTQQRSKPKEEDSFLDKVYDKVSGFLASLFN